MGMPENHRPRAEQVINPTVPFHVIDPCPLACGNDKGLLWGQDDVAVRTAGQNTLGCCQQLLMGRTLCQRHNGAPDGGPYTRPSTIELLIPILTSTYALERRQGLPLYSQYQT